MSDSYDQRYSTADTTATPALTPKSGLDRTGYDAYTPSKLSVNVDVDNNGNCDILRDSYKQSTSTSTNSSMDNKISAREIFSQLPDYDNLISRWTSWLIQG